MHHNNGSAGQFQSWIVFRNCGVIPICNPAKIDSSQRVRCELDLAADSGDVVRGYNCAENSGNVVNLRLGFGKLRVRHWTVRRAEVHSARKYLTNSTAT